MHSRERESIKIQRGCSYSYTHFRTVSTILTSLSLLSVSTSIFHVFNKACFQSKSTRSLRFVCKSIASWYSLHDLATHSYPTLFLCSVYIRSQNGWIAERFLFIKLSTSFSLGLLVEFHITLFTRACALLNYSDACGITSISKIHGYRSTYSWIWGNGLFLLIF